MSVQMESITFNHDSMGHAHDALNIRRNAAQAVSIPEWQRGVSVAPEDAPAAYSLADVRGNRVTIKAAFRRTAGSSRCVRVRALDIKGRHGCLYAIIVAVGLDKWFRPPRRGLLGSVCEQTVCFGANNLSGDIELDLHHHRLDTAGVERDIVMWRWQYRDGLGPWQDMGFTQHEVFGVTQLPTAPWQQQPSGAGNTQLPWTDALRHACGWARGAHTADEASAKITSAIYALGPGLVEYDCPGGGSSHYSSGQFDLSAFLDRLAGGVGNGVYVNCSDCATFVSTFADLVGADLWQSRMGWGFQLNPLLAIGSPVWQTACGWPGFNYHEVAWAGACTANENIWDACLQVDIDADPTAAPHIGELPRKMRFGNAGDGDYRDRLSPSGACDPQPTSRARRAVI
jgi:hypothetical protein